HVEGVINLRLVLRFFAPGFESVVQAAADRLHYKVNMAGGAAESRGHMAGVEVIIADRAAKRQFEMGMDINTAGEQVFSGAVHNLVPIGVQVAANNCNDFAFDQYVSLYHIAGGDYCSVLE